MLADIKAVDRIAESLLEQYLTRYPELQGSARIVIAETESTVRIVTPESIPQRCVNLESCL